MCTSDITDDYETPSEKKAKESSIYDFIDRDYKAEYKQLKERYEKLKESHGRFEMFSGIRIDNGYKDELIIAKTKLDKFVEDYPHHLI